MGLWSASIACAVNQNNQITFRLSFHEMQGIKQVRTISVGLPPALFMMVRDRLSTKNVRNMNYPLCGQCQLKQISNKIH